MKILCFVLFVALLGFATAEENKYPTKYDNINLEQIINNDRLLGNYVNCLLEKGKCTPEGNDLKTFLPDALKTDCSKCSAKQREGGRKVIQYLIKEKRPWWNELAKKYDPQGQYVKRHQEELKKAGIKI